MSWPINGGRGGGLISGWDYKRNLKNVSERRDKTYLRNELKLKFRYILSYIYITFIVRHKVKMQKEHTFTVDGLISGGLISGIIYSFENGWAYIRGKLKTGLGLKVGFYGTNHTVCYGNHGYSHSVECRPYNLAHRSRFSHRWTDRHKRSVKYNFIHDYFL